MARNGLIAGHDGEQAEVGRSYRRGIRKGLLKIMSKMGISTISGYRGAQLFERSEEHTSDLQSLMRISYAVFCLTKKTGTRLREHVDAKILGACDKVLHLRDPHYITYNTQYVTEESVHT